MSEEVASGARRQQAQAQHQTQTQCQAQPQHQVKTQRQPRPQALLSVDFEDWHQLVRRRLGDAGWRQRTDALPRQTHRLLALFDELGVKATFFVLGIAARAYPELVELIAADGHEIASHGDQHRPVHTQTIAELSADLRSARQTIEQITGRSPRGYRAPAFSITQSARWAYEVLVAEGFDYDSSVHDSPRIRRRITPPSASPHLVQLPGGSIWELPLAVWRIGGMPLPVGGASYWSLLPRSVVLGGLHRAGSMPALYLHPHELDPQPLRSGLSHSAGPSQRVRARARELRRNAARRRAAPIVRAIAQHFELITYREAHAELEASRCARPGALPNEGEGLRRPL